MKNGTWLTMIAVAGVALAGCSNMHSHQANSGNTGTMRRADSGPNSSADPAATPSACQPGDTRESCPPNSNGSRTNSTDRSSESSTDVETPKSGAPIPR